MKIEIVRERISGAALKTLAQETYQEMIKAVVDVTRQVLAVGGEWHADAEAVLLEEGSKQADLWGVNLYPDKPAGQRIVYEALINIRPGQGNESMGIEDEGLRRRIARVVEQRVDWAEA